MKMIAVFANQRDFDSLTLIPKEKFRWIKRPEDIRGIEFDGIITASRSLDFDADRARYELKNVQPELFKR